MPRNVGADDRHDWYDAEPVRFHDLSPELTLKAAQVTQRCAARWATRYEAWPVGHPSLMQAGALPEAVRAREAVVADLDAWLARLTVPDPDLQRLGVRLYRGDQALFDQHDGLPGEAVLRLTPRQFAAMQGCLEQADLPRDLYYPEWAQRRVVEPTHLAGRIVLVEMIYSPLAWQERQAEEPLPLRAPSDADRQRNFRAACDHLSTLITGRLTSFGPIRNTSDQDERDDLETLLVMFRRLPGVDDTAISGRGETQHGEARADVASGQHLVPSSAALIAGYRQFLRRLHLRTAELVEPGREPEPGELQQLGDVGQLIIRLMLRTQGSKELPPRPTTSGEQFGAPAGWPPQLGHAGRQCQLHVWLRAGEPGGHYRQHQLHSGSLRDPDLAAARQRHGVPRPV